MAFPKFLSTRFVGLCAALILFACGNPNPVVSPDASDATIIDVQLADVRPDQADRGADQITDVASDVAIADVGMDARADSSDVQSGTDAVDVARTDAPVDATPPGCTSDMVCAQNDTYHPYCDIRSGTCVECVPAFDMCPTGQYCTAGHTCAAGCRADNDCLASGSASHCDVARNACTGCNADTDCRLGTVCQTSVCVAGCTAARGCGTTDSCCGTQCANFMSDNANCGTCGHACTAGSTCIDGGCMTRPTTVPTFATTEDVLSGHSPDCLACAHATPECQQILDSFSCESITGPAMMGPSAGQQRSRLCLDQLACELQSGCGTGIRGVNDCYCGNVMDPFCFGNGGNGVCHTYIEAGLEATGTTGIEDNYIDTSLGGGRANRLLECLASHCSACF